MKKFWISWYGNDTAFELHSPWWISGWRDEMPTICAAVQAQDEEEAKQTIYQAHDTPPKDFELRFVEECPDDWSPFNDRFQKAPWMVWP